MPRGLVDSVTCSGLPWLSEVLIANLTKVSEADPFGVLPHQFYDIVYRSHKKMVSVMILDRKGDISV